MNKISKLSLAVALAGYGVAAVAAVEDAGHVQWGAVEVTPTAKLQLGYDDNLFKDDKSAESSAVYALGVSSEFKAQNGLNTYALTFDALNKQFKNEDDANYSDVSLAFDGHHEFTSRNRLDLNLAYGIAHDEGSKVAGSGDTPEYKKSDAGLKYGFGSTEAKMRFDLFGDYSKSLYNTYNGVDEGQNRNTTGYGATAFYRFMPKTDLVFEVKERKLKYSDQDDASYDVLSYLVGLNWEATAKTTGFAKLARRERTAEAADADKESFNGWEVGVTYTPVDRSVFNLSATRDYGLESDNPTSAAFLKSTATTMGWMYNATSKITTHVSYTLTDEEVQSSAGVTQKDRKIADFTVSADWQVKRNATVSLSYTNTDRDEKAKVTGTATNDYKRNVYMLTAELAI